jgi:hypothetical protein
MTQTYNFCRTVTAYNSSPLSSFLGESAEAHELTRLKTNARDNLVLCDDDAGRENSPVLQWL